MNHRLLDRIFEGMALELALGPARITRISMHPETKELVADAQYNYGKTMHLSMRYLERVLG